MTRSGSLVYYLGACVVGCFFMSIAVIIVEAIQVSARNVPEFAHIASAFMLVYFFGLVYGATTALLYGFILRRLMILTRAVRAWQWVLAGSVLVIPFYFTLHYLEHFQDRIDALPEWVKILTGGVLVDLTFDNRLLIPTIVAGALTSGVLFYVHRAFSQSVGAQS